MSIRGRAVALGERHVWERAVGLGERRAFGRKRFQTLFRRLHSVALSGLNYGLDDPARNGEYRLLDQLAVEWTGRSPVVFDVGGFRGDWSAAVLERVPRARVFTFEPNTSSFQGIQARLGERARVQHIAFGAEEGLASLSAPPGLPQLGSLHERDLQQFGLEVEPIESVRVTTVDAFCAEQEIDHLDLLKLDVEGHELAALEGATGMLGRGAIGAVQFEFGGTHIDSRVFLRDLVGALAGYQVSRILRDGLDPLAPYDERAEVFTLSNFVAFPAPEPGGGSPAVPPA